MTLEDVIALLIARRTEGSLTDMAITRLVFLAYELGTDAGRKEAHESALE